MVMFARLIALLLVTLALACMLSGCTVQSPPRAAIDGEDTGLSDRRLEKRFLHDSNGYSTAPTPPAMLDAQMKDAEEAGISQLEPAQILDWLREQDFNKQTEAALLNHPLVKAAEAGKMPLDAVKLVLFEEFSIEHSDLRSMAAALARFGGNKASRSFFLESANDESTALKDLVSMAKVLGLKADMLASYQPMPAAHAYSAYLAQLSNFGGAAAIAAGFAVNFPTWGKMCGRIRDALLKPPYSLTPTDVQFFTDFADPTPGYDNSATAVIAEGMSNGETPQSIRSAVMLLQGYEIMFWDAVWARSKSHEQIPR